MKRTLTIALSTVLGASLATSALAQENFPDVPENHWAYEALREMKREGLLMGYPDGLFRGGRPASRYEMAVALHGSWLRVKSLTDGLNSQIAALTERIERGTGMDPNELRSLRDSLAAAQQAIDNMKSWGDDIANMKRMASTFERELASMGVDVEAMKKSLSDLADRVGALEKRKLPVDISGTIDFLILGGISGGDDKIGLGVDGRPWGVGRGSNEGNPAGIDEDLSVLHEATFTLKSTNDEGPKWQGTFVIGNILNGGSFFSPNPTATGSGIGFSFSDLLTGTPYGEGSADFFIQNLEVHLDTSLLGLGFNARIGRLGHQVGSYFMKRPDTTPYYNSAIWDNGNYVFDGAAVNFGLGAANVTLFGGRNSNRLSVNGQEIGEMFVGSVGHQYVPGNARPLGFAAASIPVDQSLGVTASIPLTDRGKLNLNYLIFQSNTDAPISSTETINRATVFGGELDFMFGNFGLNAGYSQANHDYTNSSVIDKDNYAWWVKGSYNARSWNASLGYRYIAPQFGAPGDWGRLGLWWNPTDIEGFHGKVNFNLGENLRLALGGEYYTGTDTDLGGVTGLTRDDTITRFTIDASYNINSSWSAMLGAELVDWDLEPVTGNNFTGGKPQERWYRIGLGYAPNANTRLTLNWHLSDIDSKGVTGFALPFSTERGRNQGSLLTTQLSIRF
ncbi:MAG: S-layer homology domain-containing protein [Fimbriimonadaceae bacterium]